MFGPGSCGVVPEVPHAAADDVFQDSCLRTREKKTLTEPDAEIAERVELFAPFDSFRDDVDRERAREQQQRFHRRAPPLVPIHLA